MDHLHPRRRGRDGVSGCRQTVIDLQPVDDPQHEEDRKRSNHDAGDHDDRSRSGPPRRTLGTLVPVAVAVRVGRRRQ